jgi:predicted dehydrogenase
MEMRTDILTSAILDFLSGQAIFTRITQIVPFQRVQIFGTRGRIEVAVPCNAPPDRPCRVYIDDGSDLDGRGIELLEFGPSDQYTTQGDSFSRSIREAKEPPISLEDSIRNMAIIEGIFRSAKSGRWESPSSSSY